METQQTPPEWMGSLTESEGGPLQRAEWESDMAGAQEPGLGHRPGDAAAPHSGTG